MVAVQLKFAIAVPANPLVYGWLREHLPRSAFLPTAGLYGGLLSSLTEIGLTLLWRRLGDSADRAIGIGLGAGAFEAFWFGAIDAGVVLAALVGYTQLETVRERIDATAAATPVFWLVAPIERVIAVLCHASSRALVLLGTVHRRPWMIFWGFAIFTLLDGIATAAIIHGKLDTGFIWWVELAFVPLALVSIPILRWCWVRFGRQGTAQLLKPEMAVAN
jgi:hypothetical protein